MRILHCGKFYPPHPGGMETFLHDLAQAQARAGHEVLVLAHGPSGRTGGAGKAGSPRIWLARASWTLSYAPLAPSLPWLLVRALRRFRPEVLHVHAPNPAAVWPLIFGRGLPMALQWHADVEFPPDRRPWPPLLAAWRGLERRLLDRAGAVGVSSPAYLAASRFLAGHAGKCRCIPLGLGPERLADPRPEALARAEALWPGPGVRVLAVGRLAHYKGFDVLLGAVGRCPGTVLVLAGEGEEAAALADLRAGLGLQGRVTLAGAVPDDLLAALYATCDLFCLPSLDRSEAFGMVLLEAMRFARPCVVSDIPGSGPAWVAGEAGLAVPPGDAPALALALATLAADPGLRESMGQAAQRRLAGEFTIEAVARRWEEVYRDLVGR